MIFRWELFPRSFLLSRKDLNSIFMRLLNLQKKLEEIFFDFYFVDDEHLCFTIADVSGKGVPASLFMAVSKTLLKTKSQTEITPDKILSQVNNLLCDENDSAMFVTTFYAILNTKTGEIIYSNGGHNLPYPYQK